MATYSYVHSRDGKSQEHKEGQRELTNIRKGWKKNREHTAHLFEKQNQLILGLKTGRLNGTNTLSRMIKDGIDKINRALFHLQDIVLYAAQERKAVTPALEKTGC